MVMDQLWFILDMADSVRAFKFVNECLWNSLAELVVKLSEYVVAAGGWWRTNTIW